MTARKITIFGRNTDHSPLTDGERSDKRPHVVIIGGGFGGLYAARALADAPVRITLVDRRNYHLFQPLLYQVATALLSPSDIASPIRKIVRGQRNVQSFLAEAVGIKPDAKQVVLEEGVLDFDYLIVATGSTHAYFGHEEWEAYAPGLKTVEDALSIRRRILHSYEAAERKSDYPASRSLLTYVIVGAGPTGVEMAGALSDLADAIAEDFRQVNRQLVRILIIEAGERILPGFPPALSDWAKARLIARGVEVLAGKAVTNIDEEGVSLGDELIQTRNVFWAAGVSASPLGRALGAPLDKAGRVLVREDLTVPGHPDIFVIGDLASVANRGTSVPGVATAAIQEGRAAAANIRRSLEGRPRRPFVYKDKGLLATISRGNAIAAFPRVQLRGFPAKVIWLVVHIYFLIGFRNRLIVLIQWLWAAVTRQRGARLITEK